MSVMTKDREFLEAVKASPVGAKIAEEAHRREVERRAELAKQLAAIDAHQAAEHPRLMARIESTIAEKRKVERALAEVGDKLMRLDIERTSLSHGSALRGAEIRAQLHETASPLLAEFRRDMHAELDAARKALDVKADSGVTETGHAFRRSANNVESIDRRVRAIMAAMDAADAAAEIPNQSNISKLLDDLRAGLPPVERAVLPPLEKKK